MPQPDKNIPFVEEGGERRYLANLSSPFRMMAAPTFGEGDNEELIPEEEWDVLIDRLPPGPDDPFLTYVHDQDGVGQCNCDAVVATVESTRIKQGLPPVRLSAADLYDRINGGRDAGSTLEDGLEEARVGLATGATAGLVWHRGQRRAKEEYPRFRVIEWAHCPTFQHVMSAALKGRFLVSGIMWYNNYKTDRDGWLPERGTGSPGGHAIMGYKAARKGKRYGIWHQNSWTGAYGVGGRMILGREQYGQSIGGWWCCRAVTDEGGVVPPAAA